MHPDKPKYYIVDPLAAAHTDMVAAEMLNRLWDEYSKQQSISIPRTQFDKAFLQANSNGAFSYTKFVNEVKKAGFPMFDEKYLLTHLQKAIETKLPQLLNIPGLRALQDNGTIVFINNNGEGEADSLVRGSVVAELKKHFGKIIGISETVNETEWIMRTSKDRVAPVTFVESGDTPARYSSSLAMNAQLLEGVHAKKNEKTDISLIPSRYADATDLAKITRQKEGHALEVALVVRDGLTLKHKGIRDIRKLEDVVPLQQRKEGLMLRLESIGGMLK